MRTSFALASFVAAASAFTTGHVGNAYAGGSWADHSHQDHLYGYDSVPTEKRYRVGGANVADNQAAFTAVSTNIEAANTARINYLQQVRDRKRQRLNEIHSRNLREISAPFEYQIRLLAKESDDVIVAMTEATNDAADAFTDMLARLDQLLADKLSSFDREKDMVQRALQRASVDQKDGCRVLRSMRVEWTKNIACANINTAVSNTNTVFTDDATDWRIYEGMFDDFHYDIGHGKGLGSGSVDAEPVTDGFRSGSLQAAASGDSEVSFGSPVRTTEYPRNSRGGRF